MRRHHKIMAINDDVKNPEGRKQGHFTVSNWPRVRRDTTVFS